MHGGQLVVVLGLVGSIPVGCRAAPQQLPPLRSEPALAATPTKSTAEPNPQPATILPQMAEVVSPPSPEADPPPPEPEPEPLPFEGRERVQLRELIAELDAVATTMAEAPAVRADYEALVASHDLEDSEALYRDYVRVKLAFEATRDGGLWNLRWTITNEQPNSDRIWAQWKKAAPSKDEAPLPTAFGECDELSALFAFVAHKLGVRHIGLFWPTWNHVVAVWTVQSSDDTPVRIVVPTSQIFLGADDSLGTRGFDPWTQKTIYEYRRRDVKDSHRIDATLAQFFVARAREFSHLPQSELQRLRNARDLAMERPD